MREPLPPDGEVTRLLHAWSGGDDGARDRLMPLVYQELRRRAAGQLRRGRRGHTLRPTDLVHETYLRLCAQNAAWENRDQLFAVASRLMRRILVDHARKRAAGKRGLLDLDTALDELADLDPRQAALVEMRFFGGLDIEQAARALAVSVATANRDWTMARAWLFRRLKASA